MKKQILLFILMLLPMIASAKEAEINGINYALNSQTKTAEVIHNYRISYSGDIVIPSTVDYEEETYNVTSIGLGAFDGCIGLTSVNIPNSVTSIGFGVFNGCSNLTSVIIPDNVTSIGDYAFQKCSSLTSVTFPNNVTSIGNYAFNECRSLTSVTIPNNVTSIGNYAFFLCSGITTATIGRSVTSIGDEAFYGCNLKTIIILANVSSIGLRAFTSSGLDQIPQDVFCFSLTPPSLADSYTFNYKSTIYVLEQAVDAYNSAANWNRYTIFGLGKEDMEDFSQNGFHYGDGINNYLSCGVTSISKAGSIIGSVSYIQKTFNLFITNKHTEAITIKKVVAKDSSTDEVLATLDDASKLGELKGGETKDFSITIKKDIDPVYEIYYIYNDRLCLFNTNATDKKQFDLTIQSSGNGKVICEGKTAQSGSVSMKLDGGVAYTITITPDNGYCIESVTVNNTDVTSQVSNGQYTFTMTGNTDISVKFKANKYKLTYMVDGNVYKTYDIEFGATITPEAAPAKEGYTFSGWSNIPTTMPANDVTVTGTYTVNKYKLIYKVDGVEYKTYDIEYGATITPEAAPTKEGYTFSGWNDLPQTMPARDVTVTGSFSKGAYTLTYIVDGEVYKTVSYDYGASITPEAEPTKEGYTFSGWSYIPQTMPAEDVTVTGSFTVNKYTLTYMVDSDVYKTYEMEYGARITPEAEPTKEGYAFSGWSEIPQTMPAHDVTVTGTFTKGAYKLIYMVDGEVYKTVSYDYGETITPEAEPTKEGYTFSGWSNIPTTMPANDVTVTGTFTVNKYKLTYMVDGEVYKSYDVEYGATITPEAEPTKEGHNFSGWSDIPQTMPAHDVTVTGSFTYAPPKAYTLTYMVDGEVYKTVSYYAGDAITPEAEPTKDGYTFSGWSEIPAKMPAHDVEVTGTFNYILIEGTVHDIAVCNNNYVLCFDDWDNNGTNRCGKGVLFGDGFFLDVSGGAVATNKGTVNLSVVNSDDDNHVTQYIADRYGSDYPNDHFNSWRLKNQQDIIAMKVTAHSKLIFFLQGNNKSGVNARIPKIFDGSRDIDSIYEGEALNDAPDAGFPSTSSGFRYEWIAPKDMLIYIGSYNGDMFLSYLIVETNESSQLSKYHTLSYYVDGKVYRTYVLTENKTINPEAAPTKDGYSFSGWSGLPQTMPDHDVIVTGSFTKGAYKLIYMVDGEVYKTVSYDYGETITPEAEPTKEGYTFSGWSNIPTTMPANDVTVTGTFTVNKYKLTYMVDGEVYKSYDVEYGATITPEAEPTKEGYKFSGWSYIPNKMPAEDVTVVGTFTQEAFVKDNVTYEINGNDASVTHADNAKGEIVIEEFVVINGKSYNVTSIADGAFQGCTGLTSIEIPATVTSIGENAFNGCSSLIIIKIGKDIKEIGSKAFANIGKSNARTRAEEIMLKVYCEAEVLPSTAGDAFENSPIAKGILYVNDDLVGVYKVVMPWNGFGTIVGLSTGIRSISIDSEDAWIFDMQGNRIDNVRKGVNIIRTRDGKTKKIVVK